MITDRTAADVEAVQTLSQAIKAGTATTEQVQQYLSDTNKGAYNASDFNRVETAVAYLEAKLTEYGYQVPNIVQWTWSRTTIPTVSNFATYVAKVEQIRSIISVYATTPATPVEGIAHFGVTEANDLEKILVDVEELLRKMEAAWYYCGDLYCGDI